jgi:hypothetical protein
MQRAQHKTNNAVIGAPKGWDQSKLPCDALPITITDWDGIPSCVSWWEPTAEERALIAAGAKVRLWVAGGINQHPPVCVDVDGE